MFIDDFENQDLREDVEKGSGVGISDGIIINGEDTVGYQGATTTNGVSYHTINVEPGTSLFNVMLNFEARYGVSFFY